MGEICDSSKLSKAGGMCFNCKTPVTAEDYCSGCQSFICETCEASTFPPIGHHGRNEHLGRRETDNCVSLTEIEEEVEFAERRAYSTRFDPSEIRTLFDIVKAAIRLREVYNDTSESADGWHLEWVRFINALKKAKP